MKIDCHVIQDLLPLYHDRVCSEETARLVEDHLAQCDQCRNYLNDLDEDLLLGEPIENTKPLRDVGKRIRRMKYLAFGLGLLAAAAVIFLGWAAAAKYSEFVSYLLYLLKQSLKLLIPAGLIMLGILLLVHKSYQKKEKIFPWGRAVCWVLLLGWILVYHYATCVNGGYTVRHLNLQPFLMLREALNRFTPQMILNLFLNVAVFVPFGLMLPLLFEREKKWYWALLTGLGMGIATELMQFVTAHGIGDIDDVMMDTLGTMLGWSAAMLVLSLKQGQGRRALRYLTVPVGSILAVLVIFGGYYLKPYGNFPDGPAKRPDLSRITWEKPEDLDGTEGMSAGVYKVGRVTREQSEQFAMDFAARLGIQFNDVMYYDSMIIYGDRRGEGGFLNVYYQDGSWDYNLGIRAEEAYESPMEELDRLTEYLEGLGLTIPASAEITGEDLDSQVPVIRIRVNMDYDGETLHHGEIVCNFIHMEDHYVLMDIYNRVFSLETVGHEKILGEEQAYNLLTQGKSFKGIYFDDQEKTLAVSSPVLDWKTDTKGFFQPVYRFTLTDQDTGRETTDYVAALQ